MPVSKRADRFSAVVLKSPRSARSMGMSVSCFHVCSGFSNPFCAPFQPPACEDDLLAAAFLFAARGAELDESGLPPQGPIP